MSLLGIPRVILPISVCAWLRSNELRMVSTGVSARGRSSIKSRMNFAGNGRLEQSAPYVIFGMRVAAALLFFQHGAEKLWGFAGARPVPDLLAQRGIAGLLETIGPMLPDGKAIRSSWIPLGATKEPGSISSVIHIPMKCGCRNVIAASTLTRSN